MAITTSRPTPTAAGLIEAIWVASALATVLDRPLLADDDPSVEVLALAGLLERADRGWTLAGSLRDEVPREQMDGLRQRLISGLGQAAAIAAGGAGRGWDSYSNEVLLAQGQFSAAAGLLFSRALSSMPELAAALDRVPVAIDVGVGVAAAACSLCERLPRLRVIGLDVNPRALGLARDLVADKDLGERIELRLQGVEQLQDVGVAALAHISPPFIPRPALTEGASRLFQALTPGGALVLSGISSDGDAGAIGRWQAHNAGGSALTLAECAEVVTAAGFDSPRTLPDLPPGAPIIAFSRRP